MVARIINESSGLMPHARHGGSGVYSFAVDASKFEGTGLDSPQIVHIQVAFKSLIGAGEAVGRGEGDPDPTSASAGLAYAGVGARLPRAARTFAFGKSVIFGDDLRNPA